MENKYQETLDKRRFFNQRAGRELWNDKPTNVQNKDIESAERDYDTLQELIDNYSKLEKALDKACKDCEALDEGLAYETSCDNFEVDSWEVRKKRYLEESEDNSNGN